MNILNPNHGRRGFNQALLLFVSVAIALSPAGLTTARGQQARRFTDSLQFREVAPGIEHGQGTSGARSQDEATGPWFINVLRVDLTEADVKVVRALDEGVGMETVSSLVARHGAVAGINGGYFRTSGTYRGESLGLLLLNGKLLSESHNDRAVVGLIKKPRSTDLMFGHLKFFGELSLGPTRHTVNGLNRAIAANELLVFTPEFHRTTLTNKDVIEVVVRRNKVVEIKERRGSSEIPRDGFVIAAAGTARDWIIRHSRKGATATFSWRLHPLENHKDNAWRQAFSILGGGPQLIRNGTIAITNTQEMITPAFTNERHPRTAVAKTASGKLLLVTVDGRQPRVSAGMSLPTFAELLLELGAVEAINLDGGGSTAMVIKDKVVNRPSDQTGERQVSDALLVFSK